MAQADPPLSSNNPYRQGTSTSRSTMDKGQMRSLDSDKQVISSEMSTGPENAPIVVGEDRENLAPIPVAEPEHEAGKEVASSWQTQSKDEDAPIPVGEPEHEAGKEVISSWQTQSRDQSAPISMDYHESKPNASGDLMNDAKGPPPAYDAISQQQRSPSDDLLTTPTAISPDGSDFLPSRPEDRSAVGQLLTWIPHSLRRPLAQMPALHQPVIIPQLDAAPQGESVPFTRCYSEALASHDIPMSDFLSFIDGLALAQAPNAALQGLKMFGVGVSKVPLPIIPWAGTGVSKLATSGSGNSSSRARLYIERARKEYFAPRGLSIVVVRDGDLSARLGIPTHASRLAPLTKNSLAESCCRRRLGGLAPYVAPLKFNVPEQEARLQGVHKMARKHLESQMRSTGKKVTRLRERQWADVASLGSEAREWDEQYSFKIGQLRRVQDDIIAAQNDSGAEKADGAFSEKTEALDGLQKELQLLETQRYQAIQYANVKSKGVEAEMEEINICGRLKWIVIENLQS